MELHTKESSCLGNVANRDVAEGLVVRLLADADAAEEEEKKEEGTQQALSP